MRRWLNSNVQVSTSFPSFLSNKERKKFWIRKRIKRRLSSTWNFQDVVSTMATRALQHSFQSCDERFKDCFVRMQIDRASHGSRWILPHPASTTARKILITFIPGEIEKYTMNPSSQSPLKNLININIQIKTSLIKISKIFPNIPDKLAVKLTVLFPQVS